jgi:hypothetical protein
MKPTKQCPLVMIEWMDSVQPQSRWTLLTAVGQPDGVRCVSVGWLVSDTKRSKSVAPNMGAIDDPDSLQVSGVITIPSRCILKVTKLKEPSVGR